MSGIKSAKPELGQQITSVRKRLGLSQAAFAEKLSTSQSNVAKWEAGTYKPSPQQFMQIARLIPTEPESLYFMELGGVPSNFFLEAGTMVGTISSGKTRGLVPATVAEQAVREAEEKRVGELAATGALRDGEGKLRHIPLLKDAAAAGTTRAVNEKEIERLVPMPSDWFHPGGTLFMVKVSGDSMEPILLDGHMVVIDVEDKDPKTLVNEMVAARDDDGVTVKWLREDDGDLLLVPHHVSVRHPVRRLKRSGNISIVGKVVRWIGAPPRPPAVRASRKK